MSDRTRDEHGLDASPEFQRYLKELRRTWPHDKELAAKYGVSTENGQYDNPAMTEATTGETEAQTPNTAMGRRAFCVGAAGTIALAGVGAVAADDMVLDFDNDAVPNPRISATTTKETHEPGFSPLTYYDDSVSEQSLPAAIDDSDGEDVYGVRADRIDASDYRTMPRGVEEEDGDDDVSVSAIDADRWSGDLTVDDGDTPIDSVAFSGAGASTFDANGELEIEFDPRQYVQVGVNVDTLEADSLVEIKAIDDAGDELVVSIDPDGDADDAEIVATGVGDGKVYQVQMGDLPDEVDEITELEVEITGTAEVTLFALNLERTSRWEYGATIVEDENGDEETETVREPEGEFTLVDLDGDLVDDSTIYDLEIPVVYDAENAEIDTDHTLEETERYPPYDAISTTVSRIEVPTAYELDHSDLALDLEQEMGGDRYSVIEMAEDTADDDTEDIDWSSVTDQLEGEGETATLEDLIQTDTEYAVRVEMLLTDSETDNLYTTVGGGMGARGGSGGWLNWIMTGLAGLAGFVGIRRFFGGE